MVATHITTVNGTTSVPLTDRQGAIDEVLAGYLSRLDGKVLSSIALWRLPEGVLLGEPKAHTASDDNYLQSAGSAEAMTIEIRKTEGATSRQYAVRRNLPGSGVSEMHTVTFGNASIVVPSREVFTAAEAAPIYQHYYETVEVPGEFGLRELNLDVV